MWKFNDICLAAAYGGHLEVLRWAREHGAPWDEDTCIFAAHGGHLDVLQWARKHDCPWWSSHICLSAAQAGQLEVLQWMRKNAESDGEAWKAGLVRCYAAGPRKPEVLKWLDGLAAP